MTEKQLDLEATLKRLEFVEPSMDYASLGLKITNRSGNTFLSWTPRVAAALCLALTVSIGLNFLQLHDSQTQQIAAANSGTLQANDITEQDSIYRFLCLTKTSVIINDSLNLGELNGFGEWVFFQTPENFQLEISLLPLRDWNALGTFENGVISLQPNESKVMELRNVGIGPSSLKRGGPFPVYGNIQDLSNNTDSNPSPDRGTGVGIAANNRRGSDQKNAFTITNVVAGIDTTLNPLTEKYFGVMLRNGECG